MPKTLTVWITKNWKILRDGNTRPRYLPLEKSVKISEKSEKDFSRNLRNPGQETTVRTGHGTTDWFQIGKGVHQGCILSPCLFNLYAEYIMWNARLDESRARIKIARRNIDKLRYADDTTFMAECEEELKSLFFFIFKTKYLFWNNFRFTEKLQI